jgi:hypothetical protein
MYGTVDPAVHVYAPEVPDMITKYFTITMAQDKARNRE